MSDTATDVNALVSHEDANGRVLTGVGVSAEQLAETMERHAPEQPADPPQADAPVEAKPPTRGRQRFSDLTRERDEARAEAAAARAAREAAERERDEARSARTTPPPEPEPEPEPKAAPQPTRPEPTEAEIGTKYQTWGEYQRDLTRWVFEQERAAMLQEAEERTAAMFEQRRSHESFASAVQSSQDRARKVYPDFDALLNGPTGKIPLGRSREEAIERVAFIAAHPQSEHIQYQILKTPGMAEQLSKADPYTFGITIAGLIPSSAAAPAPAKPAAREWTPPPAPYPTVGASTPTTTKPTSEMAKGGFDYDKSGYREARARERGVKPRRF